MRVGLLTESDDSRLTPNTFRNSYDHFQILVTTRKCLVVTLYDTVMTTDIISPLKP